MSKGDITTRQRDAFVETLHLFRKSHACFDVTGRSKPTKTSCGFRAVSSHGVKNKQACQF